MQDSRDSGNPFKYRDPHGENVLGFLTGVGEIIVGGVICLTGGALEVATCGGYTFALGFHEAAGIALMTHGAAQASYHSRDMGFGRRGSHVTNKHTNIRTAKNDNIDGNYPGNADELEKNPD